MTNSNEKNLFSIVIPTYNHARYINKCLDSLISQTYSNWEAIIVNNFSEDNTIELIEAYKDNRLKIVNYKNKGIIGASRNIGIKNSSGSWICFLDSDDWWYPNKLEVVHNHINDNQHIDVICHDLMENNISIDKLRLLSCGPVVLDLYKMLLLQGNRFFNSALSIKKETLKKHKILYNESVNVITVEDYDLSLQLASSNAHFSCINTALGEYTVGINNISYSKIRNKNLQYLLRKHVFELQVFESDKQMLWGKVWSRLLMIEGAINLQQLRYGKSITFFLSAIKLSRSSFLNYFSARIVFKLRLFIKKNKLVK